MRTNRILPVALALATAQFPALALPLSLFNVAVTENFDLLASSGTSAALPAGWSFRETGTGANALYATSTGSSTSGDTYSFGANGSSERALGALQSSSVATAIGTIVTNQTGAMITDLAIAYTGEQWRLGATGRSDRLDFAYSLDATDLATGTWTDVDELDFASPATTGAGGGRDGNASANRKNLSYQLSGLNLSSGSSLMLRWSDYNATGSDDGLAIDDFSIMAVQDNPTTVAESLPSGVPALALGGLVVIASRRPRRLPTSVGAVAG
jgi:hypothetical protein